MFFFIIFFSWDSMQDENCLFTIIVNKQLLAEMFSYSLTNIIN